MESKDTENWKITSKRRFCQGFWWNHILMVSTNDRWVWIRNFSFIIQRQSHPKKVRDAVNWHYFQQVPKTTSHLLNSLIKITTEIAYELPLFKTIELLTASDELELDQIIISDQNVSVGRQKFEHRSATSGKLLDFGTVEQQKSVNNNLYVYVFHHSNSMDMRGNINYFGGECSQGFCSIVECAKLLNFVFFSSGAQHSADLPFLFGPSLFKQISRRRLSQTEEKLCKKFKQLFGDFIKTG